MMRLIPNSFIHEKHSGSSFQKKRYQVLHDITSLTSDRLKSNLYSVMGSKLSVLQVMLYECGLCPIASEVNLGGLGRPVVEKIKGQ